MLVPGVACLNINPRQNPWGCCVSAALGGSCLDLLRRSCNIGDKLLKPVRGDSVFRRALLSGKTVLGYAANVVWNVMTS
jgi:hypothetical protein